MDFDQLPIDGLQELQAATEQASPAPTEGPGASEIGESLALAASETGATAPPDPQQALTTFPHYANDSSSLYDTLDPSQLQLNQQAPIGQQPPAQPDLQYPPKDPRSLPEKIINGALDWFMNLITGTPPRKKVDEFDPNENDLPAPPENERVG